MENSITLAAALVNAVIQHLRSGGSHLEAFLLADAIAEQANAPAREAAKQEEIAAAVNAASASKKAA
jgi:hypothetical protein